MFFKILILSIITSVAIAGNPDAPGYVEPRITFDAGKGTIRSDMAESNIVVPVKLNTMGLSIKSLMPLNDRASILLNFALSRDRSEWEGNRIKQKAFRFSIAVRFYLKGD